MSGPMASVFTLDKVISGKRWQTDQFFSASLTSDWPAYETEPPSTRSRQSVASSRHSSSKLTTATESKQDCTIVETYFRPPLQHTLYLSLMFTPPDRYSPVALSESVKL
ncbi:hypothetical protein BaRGS_00014353 [Batillaria attramentaria]|uniref:Uncharacterized protein n=1 Tax=Batillaria attramentaria TaxID=370345 RepID=A0ABD0L582_9CAEN